MSMHQIEYFIEEAIRATANSSLPTDIKRNTILTLFEMESYGDCGFTNLRTIDEMVKCKYTTLYDAEEMYDYAEHPEYYADEHYYTGPDGVYYDRQQKKYCVDSGSKAWEIMVQKNMITGEAAEAVEMMPFFKVFKEVKNLIGEMDSYLEDGFHCTLFLTGAFDEMTDEESLELLGKTKEEFEEYIEQGEQEEATPEHLSNASFPPLKTADILGTTITFEPDVYLDFMLESAFNGYKSAEGTKINIFDLEIPFIVEIKPFLEPMKFQVMTVIQENGYSTMDDAINHMYHKSVDPNIFNALVANARIYLTQFTTDKSVLSASEYSYKIKNKLVDPNIKYNPKSIRVVTKIANESSVTTEIFLTMSRTNGQSFEIYCAYTFGLINGAEMKSSSEYITNISRQQYCFSGTTKYDLFNIDIPVSIDLNSINFEYADSCVWSLNHMSDELIDKLCEFSILYCEDFCDAVGEEPPKIENKRDILQYIKNPSLIVNIPKNSSIVVHLSFDCDWEEEHGLEWIMKDGKILYVGAYGDEPEYAEESYYHNSWNYANLKK